MPEKLVYKPAGVAETFSIGWLPILVPKWAPSRRYNPGDLVTAHPNLGWVYIASTLDSDAFGWSGFQRPDWRSGDGETCEDGSLIWTARRPGDTTIALPSIATSVWTLDAGVTEDSRAVEGFDAFVTVSGGEAGEQYRLTNRILRSNGAEEEDSIVLEILKPADV